MSNGTVATIAKRFGVFAALNIFAAALLAAAAYTTTLNTFDHDPGAHILGTPAPAYTALMAGHHCWTGQAPAHTIPGHVVAMTPGGHTTYAGRALTARALDQYDGHDHHITVIAFCR